MKLGKASTRMSTTTSRSSTETTSTPFFVESVKVQGQKTTLPLSWLTSPRSAITYTDPGCSWCSWACFDFTRSNFPVKVNHTLSFATTVRTCLSRPSHVNEWFFPAYLFNPGDPWVGISSTSTPECDVIALPGRDYPVSGHGLHGRGNQHFNLKNEWRCSYKEASIVRSVVKNCFSPHLKVQQRATQWPETQYRCNLTFGAGRK